MRSADFQIRPAEAAEVDGLAAIELAAAALFPAGRVPDTEETLPRSELLAAIDESLLFVAHVSDRLVGFAASRRAADAVHLNELAVDPEYGRRGIGRALVQAVISASRARRLVGVTLTTFSDLPFNGPFYRSMGFRVIDDDGLSDQLRQILADEQAQGMVRRVAMRFEHRSPGRR